MLLSFSRSQTDGRLRRKSLSNVDTRACTVFVRSEAVTVGSNPTQGMDVWCVYAFFCVCVVLCLGSGLVTG
jgi:hypothetical protein